MKNPKDIFVEECDELLAELEQALLSLEENPSDPDLINSLFRSVHTIKGSAGVFSFDHLVSFTHVVENLIDDARSDPNIINTNVIAALLKSRDHIENLVTSAINDTPLNDEITAEEQKLRETLELYIVKKSEPDAASPKKDTIEDSPPLSAVDSDFSLVDSGNWHISLRFDQDILKHGMDPVSVIRYLEKLGDIVHLFLICDDLPPVEKFDPEVCYLGIELVFNCNADKETIEATFDFVREMCVLHILPPRARVQHYADMIRMLPESSQRIGEILVASGSLTQRELEYALSVQEKMPLSPDSSKQKPLGEILVEQKSVHPEVVASALEKQSSDREKKQTKHRVLRVDADKLDKLINLVGELVIAGANSNLLVNQLGDEVLMESMSGLNHLVEEIRDQALNLRMVQIGDTFNLYKRVVRDVSKELNKDIRLIINGAETELDKTVVESLTDPLLHLVRNAMDHGIESAEERLGKGKSPQGHVYLNAYHDSGSIVVEVADDGRGLSKEKILQKAKDKGLVQDNQVLTDQEIFRLVLEAGFSTTDHVTNLSGRGVGMDVVKRNIESLRGSLDIDSSLDKGTKINLRVPLTLAIIDGFLVNVGPSYYVIPLSVVHECIEVSEETDDVDGLYGYMNLRGEVLPFLRLREFYKEQKYDSYRESIIVVKNGEQKVGFVVDELLGEFQTVIKPIGSIFEHLQGVSGATILGNGNVAVILDVPRLIDYAITKMSNKAFKHGNNDIRPPLH
jgi:two-component system chemotaxis sensor kinase CheA